MVTPAAIASERQSPRSVRVQQPIHFWFPRRLRFTAHCAAASLILTIVASRDAGSLSARQPFESQEKALKIRLHEECLAILRGRNAGLSFVLARSCSAAESPGGRQGGKRSMKTDAKGATQPLSQLHGSASRLLRLGGCLATMVMITSGCSYSESITQRTRNPDERIQLEPEDGQLFLRRAREIENYTCRGNALLLCERAGARLVCRCVR